MNNGDNSVGPLKKVKDFHKEELDRMRKDFLGFKILGNPVLFEPGDYVLPATFLKYQEKIYNFKFRPDDVVIMTFPKSGTTWTQEVVWTMRHNPNLDHPLASQPINLRCPFLEFDCFLEGTEDNNPFIDNFKKMFPDKNPSDGMMLQIADAIPEKRVIKTHLPLSFFHPSLLETCKVIFVTRNPYDVIASYYHHERIFQSTNFVGSFEDYLNYLLKDQVIFCPFWSILKEAAERMGHPNLMFLKYEDMKADSLKLIQKLNQFIDSDLSEKQLNDIVPYTSFSEMQKRGDHEMPPQILNMEIVSKDGGFFRKGEAGTGKQKFTEAQKNKMEIWISKNTIGNRSKLSKIIKL